MQAETIAGARKSIERFGSQRKAAEALDLPQRVLSDIVRSRHDHLSRSMENRVRRALGLPPVPRSFTRWADAATSVLAAAIRNRVEM